MCSIVSIIPYFLPPPKLLKIQGQNENDSQAVKQAAVDRGVGTWTWELDLDLCLWIM